MNIRLDSSIKIKKRILFILIFVYLILLGCTNNSNKIIAHINDIPVDVHEFLLVFNQNKTQVFNYFHQNYEIRDDSKFWRSEYNGYDPKDMLVNITL